MKKLLLKVTGMTCDGCANSVKKALSNVDTVKDVNVDRKNDNVSLTYDEDKVEEAAIVHAIEKIGYKVNRDN